MKSFAGQLRSSWAVMNSAIVRAAARGIILAKSAGLLDDYGEGINRTKDWGNQLLARMGYVKRKATTKAKIHSIILNLSIDHAVSPASLAPFSPLQMSVSQSESSILQGAVVFCPRCH